MARAVIVTGGAGFIGSNLVDALIADGTEVHVVDDLSTGAARNVAHDATLHPVDVRDAAGLWRVVAAVRPRTIFHLAAQADVRRSVEDPAGDADVNVVGTIRVLEAARGVGALVVLASTGGAAYGEGPDLPVPTPETCAARPLSPYGAGKVAAEDYCRMYWRLHRHPASILRLANVYGPRQDPHGEGGVVAIFCARILAGERPTVYGDGLQTRDYVYVGDVVRAFLAAERGPRGETFNIGRGREVSVLELLDAFGADVAPRFAEARLGELRRSALDPSQAWEQLRWRAQVDLAEGLRATRTAVRERLARPAERPVGAFSAF